MRLPILCAAALPLALAGVAGCAGDEVDAGTPLCTQAAYDTCATEHDCASQECVLFADVEMQVCSQSCSAANPCPDQDGAAVPCDATGYCKPAAEHVCRLVVATP